MSTQASTPPRKRRAARVLGNVALATALASNLAGCVKLSGMSGSPRYACQAPEGVACQSVSGTYANTVGHQATRPSKAATSAAGHASTSELPLATHAALSTTTASPDGLPLRTAPRVLRLWIKPWEDADGDLHDQGHVYLQIDDGRWQLQHIQHAPRHLREAVAPVPPAQPLGTRASGLPPPPQQPIAADQRRPVNPPALPLPLRARLPQSASHGTPAPSSPAP